MLTALLASGLALAANVSTAHAETELIFTGSWHYSYDPARQVVKVDAQFETRIGAGLPRGQCIHGLYLPVPQTISNIVNTQTAFVASSSVPRQPVVMDHSLEPLQGSSEYALLLVKFRGCLITGQGTLTHLTFDFTGWPPREPGTIRTNAAYVGFEAFGLGQKADVAISFSVPAAFTVDTVDDGWQLTSADGIDTYTLPAPTDPMVTDTFVTARDDSELVGSPLDPAGPAEFEIKSWPGDDEWVDFVTAQLTDGVPVLEQLIGTEWPIDGSVEVREAFTPYIYGYAGWFSASERELEIGENLDQEVVLHELAHAWFNDEWFAERWLGEGFAETFSSLSIAELGGDRRAPDSVAVDDPGAISLADWGSPGDGVQGTDDRERYGYNTSFHVIAEIVDAIGIDEMQEVLAAIDAETTTYTGRDEPEEWSPDTDWRHFLDLLQELADFDASELFTEYVIAPADVDDLDLRDDTRERYDALAERSGEWFVPKVIRRAMDDWEFDDADESIDVADEALDLRDRLDAVCAKAGLEYSDEVRTAYEDAGTDLGATIEVLTATIATAEHLLAAKDAKDGSHGVFGTIGLLGSGVDAKFDDARAAFTAGDLATADDRADDVQSAVDDATEQGLIRVAIAIGAILLALLIWLVVRAMRRRRRAAKAAAAAAVADGEQVAELPPPITDLPEHDDSTGATVDP